MLHNVCDTYIYDKNFYHFSLGIMLQFMVRSHIKINTLDFFVVRISYDELLDCQLSSCKSHNEKINESLFRSFPHFSIIFTQPSFIQEYVMQFWPPYFIQNLIIISHVWLCIMWNGFYENIREEVLFRFYYVHYRIIIQLSVLG